MRRYIYGPSLRHRASPVIKRLAWKMKVNPFPRRKGHGIVVFYFHRALANDTPRSDWRRIMGHPTVDELREKLVYLKDRFEIIPASQALELIDRRQPLQQSYAVITADDGYRDFRTHFLPLAEALSVPATFFVCTGAVTTGSVWFQKLYDLITQIRGDRLSIAVGGSPDLLRRCPAPGTHDRARSHPLPQAAHPGESTTAFGGSVPE